MFIISYEGFPKNVLLMKKQVYFKIFNMYRASKNIEQKCIILYSKRHPREVTSTRIKRFLFTIVSLLYFTYYLFIYVCNLRLQNFEEIEITQERKTPNDKVNKLCYVEAFRSQKCY